MCADEFHPRPVCPQTDTVLLLLNRAKKHLYLFVIDTGVHVAVLHKYEVGETLWSKVTWYLFTFFDPQKFGGPPNN